MEDGFFLLSNLSPTIYLLDGSSVDFTMNFNPHSQPNLQLLFEVSQLIIST